MPSFYAPSWVPLFPPTSLRWLLGMRKVVCGYEADSHRLQRDQSALVPTSMMLCLNESVEHLMGEISLKEKEKWWVLGDIDNKLEPSDKAKKCFCFLVLSNLFPRIWYIQFGCSGDSCFKQNQIQFPWHFAWIQILAFKWFVSAINKWHYYLGTLSALYFQEMQHT